MPTYAIIQRPTPDTPSANRAWLISLALYSLSHPGGIREDLDTLYALYVVVHPTSGDGALVIPESFVIPIHPLADLSSLLDLFQSTVSTQELEAMNIVLAQARGSTPGTVQVDIKNLMPQSISANLKTRQEMIDLGWFTQTL